MYNEIQCGYTGTKAVMNGLHICYTLEGLQDFITFMPKSDGNLS